MLYMVIETFAAGATPVYDRAAARGRMLPEGLEYVDSWVSQDLRRCFQLMRCQPSEAERLFAEWTANWADIVDFEIVPVLTSVQASESVLGSTAGPAAGQD